MELETNTLLLTIGFLVFILFLLGFRLLRITARNSQEVRDATPPSELLFNTLAEKTRQEQQATRDSHEARAALESLDALHRTIMEHLPTGLLVVDEDQTIRFANHRASELLDHAEPLLRTLNDVDAALATVFKALQKDGAVVLGFELKSAEGMRYIEAGIARLPDDQWLLTLVDKSREQRLEQDIRTKRDLELMGEMAAGVTHEVKNALATMQGHLQMIPYGDPEEHSAHIQEEIDALLRMVRQFMTSSKGEKHEPEDFDASDWLNDLDTYWQQHPKSAFVRITNDTSGLALRGNRHALKTVVDNLILNGLQSGGPAEETPVRLKTEEADGYLLLIVEDDGPGFSETVKTRLFTPFVSSKKSGTGLGMFHCRKVIMEHGGHLEVETDPPTRVLCYLPVS